MYATYTFYTDTYLGSALTEQEFARASKRASSFIDYYTIGKAKDYPDDDNALAMCCCALAEQYQIIENAKAQSMSGGEVKSQTVGAWSKTYASGTETAEAARKTLEDIAMDYLAWTGLLYREGSAVFPHTVTVFNSYEDDDLKMHNSITILRGVLLDVSKGTNVAKTGLADADAATLYIPFTVDAVSTTGDKKTYVEPKAFYAAENQQGLWTLDSGGHSNSTSTYFVKGEISEMMSLAQLQEKYDYAFDVSTVDVRDFGGDMMHWQVGGK